MMPKAIYPPVQFTKSIPSLGQAYQPENDQTTAYQIKLTWEVLEWLSKVKIFFYMYW